MQALFLAFILLANSNSQFEIKDYMTPRFIKNEKDSILIYGRRDYDEYYVIEYYPANDSYIIEAISNEDFTIASRLYQERHADDMPEDMAINSFIRKTYSLPLGEIDMIQTYQFDETTIKLFTHGDGHGTYNTFLVVLHEDNSFIKKFDEEIYFVILLDNYILLVIDNYSEITIIKQEFPITSTQTLLEE